MIYKPLALRRGGSSYLCSYVKVFYPFIINIFFASLHLALWLRNRGKQ
nr:MAG TPA: hypothetical protein [Caudoviricetes sp.]DAV92975.1 MAG TPA: hypothetical protein [Caudoviricetes sp.]